MLLTVKPIKIDKESFQLMETSALFAVNKEE